MGKPQVVAGHPTSLSHPTELSCGPQGCGSRAFEILLPAVVLSFGLNKLLLKHFFNDVGVVWKHQIIRY